MNPQTISTPKDFLGDLHIYQNNTTSHLRSTGCNVATRALSEKKSIFRKEILNWTTGSNATPPALLCHTLVQPSWQNHKGVQWKATYQLRAGEKANTSLLHTNTQLQFFYYLTSTLNCEFLSSRSSKQWSLFPNHISNKLLGKILNAE